MRFRTCFQIAMTFIALLVGIMLASCTLSPDAITGAASESDDDGYESPYDFSNLVKGSSGRYSYEVKGSTVSVTGVDVSDHQGYIDWDKVADDGIGFAFIRVGYRGSTEGELHQDDYYEYNIKAAKKAGVKCGVYFYSQAKTKAEAKEEAEYVLRLLDDTSLSYPVVFDCEMSTEGGRNSGLSTEVYNTMAKSFCEVIKEGGYDAMIYGNIEQMDYYDLEDLGDIPLWVAEYGDVPNDFQHDFEIWQYSESAIVSGIDGSCDLDLDMLS